MVTHTSVSVYGLVRLKPEQLGLFDGTRIDNRALSDACDSINDRYGEYTIVPALMANMEDLILDRIAFGSVKDL